MKDIKLTNMIVEDGSRHFCSLPESCSCENLQSHIESHPEITITEFVSSIVDVWIDFSFRGHEFSVNNPFGEYWFFVKDTNCPDDVLYEIAEYCRALLD